MAQYRRLYRSEKERVLGGVCGGIAEILGVDPTMVRLAGVGLVVVSFLALLVPLALFYVACWFIIPPESRVK
jgi:phage shock protein C